MHPAHIIWAVQTAVCDCAHPVFRGVPINQAASYDSARHAPALRCHAYRCPQQHCMLHNALCLAAAEFQQAVKYQPAVQGHITHCFPSDKAALSVIIPSSIASLCPLPGSGTALAGTVTPACTRKVAFHVVCTHDRFHPATTWLTKILRAMRRR